MIHAKISNIISDPCDISNNLLFDFHPIRTIAFIRIFGHKNFNNFKSLDNIKS